MARSKAGGVRRPASAHPLVERIRIQGFKSIVDQTIELGCLNVIVGANGSGKTALLEAIGVLGAAADGRVDDDELLRRGVRPGVPERFKSAFADLKRPSHSIVLRAEDAAGHYYAVSLDNPKRSPGTPWRFRAETLGHGVRTVLSRSLRRGSWWESKSREHELPPRDPFTGSSRVALDLGSRSRELHGLMDRLRSFAIYDPQTPTLRGTQSDPLARHPVGLGGGRLAEALSEWAGSPPETSLVQELAALLEWTTGVSAARSSWDILSPSVPTVGTGVCFTDRFMRAELERLSAYDASEGTLYVLFALMMG
jgi:energy-coupling factor transporter ATP-binding protein EcfA2